MKTFSVQTRSGNGTSPHPLWLRLLSVFCIALLGVASTVQLCHSHDEASAPGLRYTLDVAPQTAIDRDHLKTSEPGAPSNSAVSCPLCVAMHSALPVTHHLADMGVLRVERSAPAPNGSNRLFLWRFQLASRPPPATGNFA